MEERIIRERSAVLRHGPIELLEHWLLAFSGFVLIFSGFGELPMYKRFMLTQVPGLAWAGDFFVNLKIHYLSGIVFISIMLFHAIYHGWLGHQGLLPRKGDFTASIRTLLAMFGFGEEPKSDKYLPEQRLAYAYLGGIGLILVLTGVVKVIKNLPGVYFAPGFITAMTLTHTFSTIFFLLGVVAHLTALIFKVNRPLAKSIFTREVDLDYVQERHTVWYNKLARQELKAQVEDKVEEEKRKERTGVAGASGQAETWKKEEDMATVLKVKGMSCQHCVMSVKKALGQLDGVRNVNVDLPKGEVSFDNTKGVVQDRIQKAITDAGFEVIS
jgi:copper ion binding protein